MTVAMPSHRRKGKHGVVNTQVQSHPLLRRGFGTSEPFHLLGSELGSLLRHGNRYCTLRPRPLPSFTAILL